VCNPIIPLNKEWKLKKIGQKTDAINPRALCLSLFYWAGLVAHKNERAPQRHRVGKQKLLSLAARKTKTRNVGRAWTQLGEMQHAKHVFGFGKRVHFSGLGWIRSLFSFSNRLNLVFYLIKKLK
jgi:hypothetical protein